MSETKSQVLNGVTETLLVTLFLRAMESQRTDVLIKDEKAVELVTHTSYEAAHLSLSSWKGNRVRKLSIYKQKGDWHVQAD